MKTSRLVLLTLLTAALLGALGWYFWPQAEPQPAPGPVVRPVPHPPAIASAPVPSNDPPPVIQHPVQAIDTPPPRDRGLPALGESDARLKEDLTTLVGRQNLLKFLLPDGFVRRVVVTVDNLGREHAAPSMWPVHPTPGRFVTLRQGEVEVVNPDNAQRYVPLLQFIESINSRQAVQLYVSLYPLFQQAYVELGYPKGYFNDRLVAVIDQLLATPVPEAPLAVELVEVKGPIPSERPWTRYQFIDEDLQALAAGQKMLLRVGPANERRLKAKLLEVRKLLTRAALPSGAASAPRR